MRSDVIFPQNELIPILRNVSDHDRRQYFVAYILRHRVVISSLINTDQYDNLHTYWPRSIFRPPFRQIVNFCAETRYFSECHVLSNRAETSVRLYANMGLIRETDVGIFAFLLPSRNIQ